MSAPDQEELDIARAAYDAYNRARHPCSVLWRLGAPHWDYLDDEDKRRWVEASRAALQKAFEVALPATLETVTEKRGDLIVYGGGL